jgi:hypothetical protein
MNLTRVRTGSAVLSKRIVYPHSFPSWTPISSATRAATVCAATRRGCVHATTRPPSAQPASNRYCGICVLFPLPVSPTMINVR